MEIYQRSALKHGISIDDIDHAYSHALMRVELDPNADPPKVLFIGPSLSGHLLELIGRELKNDTLIIHAMALRPKFYDLLRGWQ